MEKSEKTAITAILAIVAIFCIIVFFKFIGLTGFSNVQVGTVDITIGAMVDITLIDANISFGNGTVTQGAPFAIIDSCGGTSINGSWAPVIDYFILENSGSVYANITISSANGAGFVGGNPAYQAYYYNYTDNETGSCLVEDKASSTYWNLTVAGDRTCGKLNFTDETDSIKTCLKLMIPSDAPPALRADQVTFSATQSE